MRFIFLTDIFCCIFDASNWWNGFVHMSFVSLVEISTFLQGDVGFAIDILSGKGGSGGGVPLSLSIGTLFLVRHNGLAPCQILHFCPDITFAVCLVMAALRSCEWEFTCYALCRQ